MFVRIKKTPNSPKTAVQLVEAISIRTGSKVRQKIIRHFGNALDDAEIQALKKLANHYKSELEQRRQPTLFAKDSLMETVERGQAASEGFINYTLQRARENLNGHQEEIRSLIRQAPVIGCHETGMRVNGRPLQPSAATSIRPSRTILREPLKTYLLIPLLWRGVGVGYQKLGFLEVPLMFFRPWKVLSQMLSSSPKWAE